MPKTPIVRDRLAKKLFRMRDGTSSAIHVRNASSKVAVPTAGRQTNIVRGDYQVRNIFTLGVSAQRLKSIERRPRNLASGIAIRADSYARLIDPCLITE